MKYSIDELRSLNYCKSEKEITEAAISALLTEKEKASCDYQKAIRNDDPDGMSAAESKVKSLDVLIESKKKSLAASGSAEKAAYSREDVKESWNEYIDGIDKSFREKYSKFLAARKRLAEMYLELAEIQRQAGVDLCHVNTLYTGSWPTCVPGCDSDLKRLRSIEAFCKTTEEKIPVSQTIGIISGICPAGMTKVIHTEDLMIRALVAAGEIPEEREEDLISVVDLGQPVYKPF